MWLQRSPRNVMEESTLSPLHRAPYHCKGRCLVPQALTELALYGDPVEILETQPWRGEACAFLLEPAGSPARPRLPSEFRSR